MQQAPRRPWAPTLAFDELELVLDYLLGFGRLTEAGGARLVYPPPAAGAARAPQRVEIRRMSGPPSCPTLRCFAAYRYTGGAQVGITLLSDLLEELQKFCLVCRPWRDAARAVLAEWADRGLVVYTPRPRVPDVVWPETRNWMSRAAPPALDFDSLTRLLENVVDGVDGCVRRTRVRLTTILGDLLNFCLVSRAWSGAGRAMLARWVALGRVTVRPRSPRGRPLPATVRWLAPPAANTVCGILADGARGADDPLSRIRAALVAAIPPEDAKRLRLTCRALLPLGDAVLAAGLDSVALVICRSRAAPEPPALIFGVRTSPYASRARASAPEPDIFPYHAAHNRARSQAWLDANWLSLTPYSKLRDLVVRFPPPPGDGAATSLAARALFGQTRQGEAVALELSKNLDSARVAEVVVASGLGREALCRCVAAAARAGHLVVVRAFVKLLAISKKEYLEKIQPMVW